MLGYGAIQINFGGVLSRHPGGSSGVAPEPGKGRAVEILAGLLNLVGLVCSIIILIHAFKASVGQGFLCLCIPFYVLYYAFARFEHPKKNLIIGVWLGSFILGGALYSMSIGAALSGLE